MMIQEFVERVGYEPSPEIYKLIEAAYMKSEKDKDEFCKHFKSAETELLLSVIDDVMAELRKDVADKEQYNEILQKQLEEQKKLYEDLWEWESDSEMKDKEYLELKEFCSSVNEGQRDYREDMLEMIAGFGFDLNKVKLGTGKRLGKPKTMRCREEDDIRQPLYGASDWNYCFFSAGGMDYEIVNGGICIV